MLSILKTFGLGLLCTILSPLILLILILYFIYTLIGVAIMFGISVYRYFAKGGSVLDELKIEKEAKKILQSQEEYNQKMRESALLGASPVNARPVNPVPNYNVPPANPTYNSPQVTPTYTTPVENPTYNDPTNNTYQEPEVTSATDDTNYGSYNTSPDDSFGGDL